MIWRGTPQSRARRSGGKPSGPPATAIAAGLACAVIATPSFAADGTDPPAAADTAALSDRVLVTAQPADVTRRVEPEREVAVDPGDFSRFGFSREALDRGRIVAVRPDESEVVRAEDFDSTVHADTVFVERVRPGASLMGVPPVLASILSLGPAVTYSLGFEITAFDAQSREPLKLKAWARDSTGLALHGRSARYIGVFNVALTSRSDPEDDSTLMAPVNIAVTAPGASIEPRPIAIGQLARWHDVSIAVPSVDADRYEISVSADPREQGDAIPLAVTRPTAALWSVPPSIVGWGIGESTVNVEVRGLQQPEGFPVSLNAVHGTLSSGRAVLDRTGHAQVKLRSSRDVEGIVEVLTSSLRAEPLVVTFNAPWLFLGSAVAGGLAGAFLRGRGRDRWLKALTIGGVSAVVMALAYAVGIDWPARVLYAAGMARAGEASVFVLGALGSLVGVSALVPGQPARPQN